MPDQAAYDKALAVAQLVLGRIYPAYLASLPSPQVDLHVHSPVPPPLTAGITTPLPPALTGEGTALDIDSITTKGVEALEALEVLLGEGEWALGIR